MPVDYAIVRKLWEGDIPGKFVLAQHEVATGQKQPEAYFMMLPRNSYFPLIVERIHKHFLNFTEVEKEDEMWLEYDGQPIKWHYPVGVLFDLLVSESNMPWQITIHFQDFPADVLLRCPQIECAEANYMSALKEADQLKHRGQVMNNMNKTQHKQLWHSLRSNNFEQFWSVNKILMDGFDGKNFFKHIPIKIYYKGKIYQKLIPSQHGDKIMTLNDAIEMITCGSSEAMKPVVQGIFPSLSTELQWLSENLCSPDNFLHIILKPINEISIKMKSLAI